MEGKEPNKEEELRTRIDDLEKRKAELIERIKKLNKRIRYKKYEQKAILPFLEQTKDVKVAPFRKQKRALEFKISTAAFTPRMERELLKKLKVVDEKLDEVKEVERARRKIKFVEQDITEGEKEIGVIEEELNGIRGELKTLYDESKSIRAAARKVAAAQARAEEDMVALGDLALIEKG
jgi:chromosome segregation ATPase